LADCQKTAYVSDARSIVQRLTEQIFEYAKRLPEGTPLAAKGLLGLEQAVVVLAAQRGEVIVSSGAAAANSLGLMTQVPVKSVYLTSGRTRKIYLGKQVVEFLHAPRCQLAMAHRPAGQLVRALAWLGPEKADAVLRKLKHKVSAAAFGELVAVAPQLPTLLARSVGKAAHG
jgi:hypothetical protein